MANLGLSFSLLSGKTGLAPVLKGKKINDNARIIKEGKAVDK